jgi:type II secretory ATPase GspE/PulE/Tfp pilus assembly ATPase PilB-like protein
MDGGMNTEEIVGLEASLPEPSQLGQRLVAQGKLTPVQLDYAMQKQKVEGGRLGLLLVQHGLLSEGDLALNLAGQRGYPFLERDSTPTPDPQLLELFNRELCLTRGFMPLVREGEFIHILLGDGDPEALTDLVQRRCGAKPKFFQCEFTHVTQLVRQTYYFAKHPAESLIKREIELLSDDVDRSRSPEKLLEYILHLAVRERATDVHLAPSASSYHLLFRIDGVLRPMFAMPLSLTRLVVYVKLGAEMDISEQRRPQDGSFQATVLDSPFTVRVSTLVTEFGERMVMRLLPESSDLSRLEQLGFRPEHIALLQRVFAKPSGMVLLTGPTGSGKSTTLHAALRLQALIERNVLTVEDPIEYRLSTIAQTQVNRRAGYEFSTALRHFLRHDPDVILVGEIRDAETAQATVTASATGHLVLSTLHVASVFGVMTRLVPLGLEPQTIAENLVAIVNQRLIRRNCPFCSTSCEVTPEQQAWLGDLDGSGAQQGAGCDRCAQTGFLGRLPVYEILNVDEALANAISDGEGRTALRRVAVEAGFEPMLDMAKWRIFQGQTTFEEVWRVIGESPL